MYINKIVITNYKKFENKAFNFNEDINILVGDNDSGKVLFLKQLKFVLIVVTEENP